MRKTSQPNVIDGQVTLPYLKGDSAHATGKADALVWLMFARTSPRTSNLILRVRKERVPYSTVDRLFRRRSHDGDDQRTLR